MCALNAMNVMTVSGKVAGDRLGIITPHEHIFIDMQVFFERRHIPGCINPENEPVSMGNLGILYRDPYALKDDLVIDDFDNQRNELARFKAAGGSTVVDATTVGLGRDPDKLRRMASETGLNIIAGTGYYVGATHDSELSGMNAGDIAARMLSEINFGIDGTGVKAGVIGEIGISELFSESEQKVLRASAEVQKESGLGLLVHINPWTDLGLKAVKLLREEGVAPDRIAICHTDVIHHDDYILALLDAGVYVEFDNFGKEYYTDREAIRPGYGRFIRDSERVAILRKLIEKGYANRILLSCDVCLKILLRSYGGWGYDHILTNVVPMMEEEGISAADIDGMLKSNPADFLCGWQ